MAEYLIKAELEKTWDEANSAWSVRSAGTHGRFGHPMHPHAAEVLTERGMDGVASFRSHRLTVQQIQDASLVLTASREHRAQVVQLVPGAAVRTFTIRQAAGLSLAATASRGPTMTPLVDGPKLMAHLQAGRSLVQPARPRDDNVEDPIGRRTSAFRKCADLIQVTIGDLLASKSS